LLCADTWGTLQSKEHSGSMWLQREPAWVGRNSAKAALGSAVAETHCRLPLSSTGAAAWLAVVRVSTAAQRAWWPEFPQSQPSAGGTACPEVASVLALLPADFRQSYCISSHHEYFICKMGIWQFLFYWVIFLKNCFIEIQLYHIIPPVYWAQSNGF
jgi:hypothetical protein